MSSWGCNKSGHRSGEQPQQQANQMDLYLRHQESEQQFPGSNRPWQVVHSHRKSGSFRDGIIMAIVALGDGGNGSSSSAIKKQMQGTKHMRGYWDFEDKDYHAALKKAVADNHIVQNNDLYTLSASTKQKVAAKVREAELKKEREEAMQRSKASRDECADMLMEFLDESTTDKKKGTLDELGLKMKALLPTHSMIIVPVVDSSGFATHNFSGLKGIDKQFQDAIENATGGSWTVLAVEATRVDNIEGNPGVHEIDCLEGDINIDTIYHSDGAEMDKKTLDNLNINWRAKWDDGIVSLYKGDKGCSIWEDGDLERVGCYDCDDSNRNRGSYLDEDEWDEVFPEEGCPLDEDSCDTRHTPRYERTYHECLLVGLLKELIPKPETI